MWLWPNLLSLDAPAIAVLWLHLFAVSGHVLIAPTISLVLALAVWLIYVADRLIDGLRSDDCSLLSARHRFYRSHRMIFVSLLPAVFAFICWASLELDSRTVVFGALLATAVVFYFALVHRAKVRWGSWLPKEAAVATVFGLGSFVPVWIHAHSATAPMAIALALFILICWLNIVLIEYSEWVRLRFRRSDAPHTSTITAGKHLLPASLGVGIVASGLTQPALSRLENPVLAAITLSAVSLAALGSCWRHLSISAVRVLADAALFSPAVVLLFLHRG